MKKKIAVISEDTYLVQKIRLALGERHSVMRVQGGRTDEYDLCLFDMRDGGTPPTGCPVITMSREAGAELKIPFSRRALVAVLEHGESAAPLTLGVRCAYLRGEKIRLTELELSLLSCLVEAQGSFISREEILERVWHGTAEGGVVNVYVHYLREKLEAAGEKVIISSRHHGYKIDEKLLRKGDYSGPVSN